MSKEPAIPAPSALSVAARPTRYRWVVGTLFFLIYSVAAADRANIGIALPFLRKEFSMTNAEAGALVSMFLLAYALAQIPSAWVISRFGVRRALPVSMILTSIATGMTGVVGSLFALKICRFALGIAEGPLPLGIGATINSWFPAKEKGTASGLFLSSVKFGPVITPILGAAIISLWGWRQIFILFAIPGILFSIVWYLMVADKPADSRAVNPAERELIDAASPRDGSSMRIERSTAMPWLDKLTRVRREKPLESASAVAKSWNIYGCALGYCCQLGISSVLLAWIPTYLLNVKKVWYGLLMFVAGVALSIGFSAYMVYPTSFVSKQVFPLANAIVNMGGQLGGAATPFIAGLLLDHFGWNYVFGFMSAISALTFVILMTISEPLDVEPASGGHPR
ncbi:MAG TPA: MFS transporter [Paraburkholderia sp.]|jgi:MFS family permease